jgi:hypothetical protein
MGRQVKGLANPNHLLICCKPGFHLPQKQALHAGDRNHRHIPGVAGPSFAAAELSMNGLIYLVGLVVVILAILSFFGLR